MSHRERIGARLHGFVAPGSGEIMTLGALSPLRAFVMLHHWIIANDDGAAFAEFPGSDSGPLHRAAGMSWHEVALAEFAAVVIIAAR